MLAHRLGRGVCIIPVEYRHIVRKVYRQFYQTCHSTAFVKPRGLMQELSLSVTDNLICVCRAYSGKGPALLCRTR